MDVSEDNNLVARIWYKQGKSVDFYTDRIIFKDKEIEYSNIDGVSYGLSRDSLSVSYVPVANSLTISFGIKTIEPNKVFSFSHSASAGAAIRSKSQKNIELIFSDIMYYLNALVIPTTFSVLTETIENGGVIKIGPVILTKDKVYMKGWFREKELQSYGRTEINEGIVQIFDSNGKFFAGVPLKVLNGPLLGHLAKAIKG